MPITARELSYAAKTQVFTRNFRHLLPVPRFLVRGPFMHGQSKPKDTKPKDRIKFWNIVPGDFVKLRNDSKGTVHEVHKINKLSNRVILKREINKAVSEVTVAVVCALLIHLYVLVVGADRIMYRMLAQDLACLCPIRNASCSLESTSIRQKAARLSPRSRSAYECFLTSPLS